MTKSISEREIVAAILMEVTENGRYSHIVLRDVLDKYQYLDKRERAFITRVTEGTLEHMIEIDYILDHFSKVKVKKMKPFIRNLLRSAVYQLKYMDSIPDRAVCSEAVSLAGKKGFSGLKGYVNGVLRNIARDMDKVKYPSDGKKALSVKYSCPEWIIELWEKVYDKEVIERMLADFQKEKPTVIRCCQNRISPQELKKKLEEEGAEAEIHPYLPYALKLSGYDHLDGLKCFQEGLFFVQDISSMLVGEAADLHPGDYIIDVCAAPGGKALHMAGKLEAEDKAAGRPEENGTDPSAGCGHVEARDLTEYKVDLIRENISRSGLKNITAVCRDASVMDPSSVGKADLVIADLPCSGLGVLGKKTDLKYKASPEGVNELAALQKKILTVVKEYVKPGGMLIYSTCTVNPAENTENVKWFLDSFSEFETAGISERLCPELQKDVDEKGCIQLIPGIHDSDGFFIACFRKRTG